VSDKVAVAENSDELISEIARQRRDRVVASEEHSTDPDFLDRIEASVVKYSLRESALPLAHVDVDLLVERLASSEYYRAELAPVTPGDLVNSFRPDELYKMTQSELLSNVFKRESNKLAVFTGGRFPLRNDFVPIQEIRIDRYGVRVGVYGTSRIAEAVAQEVLELIWIAAGFKRSFESCKPDILGTLYGTVTRVNLPVSLDHLLAPEFRSFVNDNLIGGGRLGERMRTVELGSDGEDDMAVVFAPNSINLAVLTMNLRSGYWEESVLNLMTTTRTDLRSKLVRVSSALRYEDHVQLLRTLIERVSTS
jgi:hypothetical protein